MRLLARLTLVFLIAALGWIGWQRYGPRPPAPAMAPDASQIDHILIEKSDRRLTATLDGAIVLQTEIALGFAPEGDKEQEGDGKTPVGMFTIDRRNPNSAFHLSLGIDYPQPEDIARAQQQGIDPGGDIFIHGGPRPGIDPTDKRDWTAGCISVTDREIEDIYAMVSEGTPIDIYA